MPIFDSARLKIERAEHHINDLNGLVASYIERRPYRIIRNLDPDTSEETFILDAEPLPKETSAIAGDAVHNLRTALDHMACSLVARKTSNKRILENAKFPIPKYADGLEERIRSTDIYRAGEDIVEIVRSLEPYNGGNNSALRSLHDLDITDKHTTIIPVIDFAFLSAYREIAGIRTTLFHCQVRSTNNSQQPLGFLSGHIKVEHNFDFAIKVVFGPGMPFEHKPILETLSQLTHLVRGIVDRFEAHVAANP